MFGQYPQEALDTITEEEIKTRMIDHFECYFDALQSIIRERRMGAGYRKMRKAIKDRGYD